MSRSAAPLPRVVLLLSALLVVSSGPAAAVDGVVEIGQTCATTTGCLPGDLAGFPVTLGQSGSYRLTSNLTVPNASTTAIDVTTSDVTIDLNGFAIVGPTVCTLTASSVDCSPTGSGYGVRASSADGTGTENVTVRNGTVRGVGLFGVSLSGHQSRIENVRAWSNGNTGLGVNSVTLTRGGSVVDSSSSLNGGDGIFVGARGLAKGNTANANDRNGIRANGESLVVDNTMTNNISTGLNVSPTSGYARNVITNNNGGSLNAQVSGGGLQIGTNVCGTNTTCP